MSISVYDLICSSLRLAGVLAAGETPNEEEAQDAFVALNQMLDEWTASRLNVFTVGEQSFALTGAKQSYTIGKYDDGVTIADFNVYRPVVIQNAKIIIGGLEHPLDLANSVRWAAIPEKAATAQLPITLYCDYANPVATLKFHPIPSGTPTFRFYSLTPLPQFALLTDTVSLPVGYEKAIRYNLAVNLAAEFPVNALADLQLVMQLAQSTKQAIQTFNAGLLGNALGEETTGAIPTMPQAPPAAAPQQ